ncbi:MAG TPA: hypothetical protein VIC62_06915, partial [Nakamurella sp.]
MSVLDVLGDGFVLLAGPDRVAPDGTLVDAGSSFPEAFGTGEDGGGASSGGGRAGDAPRCSSARADRRPAAAADRAGATDGEPRGRR